jgi:hypothetical protein
MVEGFAFDRQPLALPNVADDGDEPAVAQMRTFMRRAASALRCSPPRARHTVGGASADEHVWREPVIEHLQMLANVMLARCSRPASQGAPAAAVLAADRRGPDPRPCRRQSEMRSRLN